MKTAILLLAAIAFDSGSCDTVLVVGQDGGPLRINASDYDESVHTLYSDTVAGEPVPPAPSAPPAIEPPVAPTPPAVVTEPAPPTAPSAYLVKKIGRGAAARVFVVAADGETKVTGVAGIDEAGYATEADAWAAIMAPRA